MSRRGLNKAIVTEGVPIIAGLGTQVCTSGENNGLQSVFIPVRYTIAADWIGTRYYAVDYDGGSDTAIGFSDTSMADAGTKAVKTFSELLTRLPRNGYGQKVVIAIKTRASGATYLKADGVTVDDLILAGFVGYSYILIRGTSTDTTAGSTAFANDTNDKICLGATLTSGTNSGGYNPSGSITVNTFDVVLAGGGAPGLAAEPGIIGKRIRFSSTTTTTALQNITSMIWKNTTNNIIVSSDLPAVPVGTDVFYIEEPGVTFDTLNVSSSTQNSQNIAPTFGNQGIFIAGIRTANASVGTGGFMSGFVKLSISFTESQATSQVSAAYNIVDFISFITQNTYIDESSTTITTGTGFRGIGIMNCSRGTDVAISHSTLSGTGGRVQATSLNTWTIGNGCYFGGGVLLTGCVGGSVGTTNLFASLLGRGNSTTTQRLRVTNPVGSTPAGITVTMSSTHIYGCEITGMGSSRVIGLRGTNQNLTINDVIGASASTGNGLDLVDAIGCMVNMGQLAANTFTNASGKDIVCRGSVFYVHADYQSCDLADDNNNTIQGSGLLNIGPASYVSNDGNATIEQYKIVRSTGNNTVRKSLATDLTQTAAVGVSQGIASTTGSCMIVNSGGTWLNFDSAPSAGDMAYLSTATAGNAQITVPTSLFKIQIGRVMTVNGTLGFVNFKPVQTSLAELTDITITSPATDDLLMYNGTNWINNTPSNFLTKYIPHGEIYYDPTIGSFTLIDITTIDVGVLVNPTTTVNSNNDNFDSPSAGSLRYTGTPTLCFHCALTISFAKVSGGSSTIYCYMYKNGVVVPGSSIVNTTASSTSVVSSSIHSLVQLSTNDYIEMYIKNHTDAIDINVYSLNLFAMGMPC